MRAACATDRVRSHRFHGGVDSVNGDSIDYRTAFVADEIGSLALHTRNDEATAISAGSFFVRNNRIAVHWPILPVVREWLEGACKSPSEKVLKERLKRLLES